MGEYPRLALKVLKMLRTLAPVAAARPSTLIAWSQFPSM
jgi:hypothetical protein